ncbi:MULTISPECIES: metallophosphoesterase family protein [Olivibacter]|uniref:Nuclease SbcCD subunit D n=1 Tax=Olivibacter jilunii TaxID=985016 RepID=A0ABW6ATJ5_9SPHI|nr:exonuclease subunit SbcD [Olivibacter sp. 47]MCL4641181.1 exonuclease subunit SbcD [Olivibacter sp. UJ_SKK_5.1]MDM8175602.1 exonuclease subunit SbcD [Olivibacter sp. 47]MDX3914210.1 exonuclease subunit SbcD [Pseudosphingobacterium sp.]
MKILHTADWHLGKRLDKYSRLEEQRAVLDELIALADEEEIDVVLVAGDLFDAFNPAAEAVELLYRSLKRLAKNGERVVIAIAGNHDSPDRIDAPDVLARECGIVFVGYPQATIAVGELCGGFCITKSEPGFLEIKVPKYDYPLRLLLMPYANEYRLRTFLGVDNEEKELRSILEAHWEQLATKYCDKFGVNILMAHLFVMKRGEVPPEEPIDEKPILHIGGAQAVYSENIPESLQYVALGHLHRYQEIDKARMPIVYSSSLLSYSFAEAGQQKNVVLIEAEPARAVDFRQLPLKAGKPLYKKRFESISEALEWLHHCGPAWIELTMVSEDFMNAEDRKQLLQAHDGIVTIIPEVKTKGNVAEETRTIDLSQSVEELFIQYFSFRNKQQPNEDLLKLFTEVRAEQIDE